MNKMSDNISIDEKKKFVDIAIMLLYKHKGSTMTDLYTELANMEDLSVVERVKIAGMIGHNLRLTIDSTLSIENIKRNSVKNQEIIDAATAYIDILKIYDDFEHPEVKKRFLELQEVLK